MLLAETACFSKSGAAFHLAHFRLATAVFTTPSPCSNSRGAAEVRAELLTGPVGTVLLAESTSNNSCTTPLSGADLLPSVSPGKPSYNSDAAAAFSRAIHFGGMME